MNDKLSVMTSFMNYPPCLFPWISASFYLAMSSFKLHFPISNTAMYQKIYLLSLFLNTCKIFCDSLISIFWASNSWSFDHTDFSLLTSYCDIDVMQHQQSLNYTLKDDEEASWLKIPFSLSIGYDFHLQGLQYPLSFQEVHVCCVI